MKNINNFYILSLWNFFETEIVANGAVLPFKNLLLINKFWENGKVFLNFSTFCWSLDFLCTVSLILTLFLCQTRWLLLCILYGTPCIHRKSKDQQKVLKFKKTSEFSQNLFIESRFLNGSISPLPSISVSKRFHSERI